MAVKKKFVSLDAYFQSIPSEAKVIVNDIRYDSSEDMTHVEDMIKSVYKDESLTIVPQCQCGHRKGVHLKGTMCPVCESIVTDIFYNKDPILWFRHPEGTEKFLNPHFWLMLREAIGTPLNLLKWITNPAYNPVTPAADYLKYIVEGIPGFARSYNWFIQNLDQIFNVLINNADIKAKNKHHSIALMYEIWKNDKRLLLSDYYPLLNKRMFYIERNSKGKFTFSGITDAYDVIMTFIINKDSPYQTRREKTMSTMCELSSKLELATIDQYLGRKGGIFRKHVYGTRSHFSARAVITSIPGPHPMDEVQLPWGLALTLFRPHVVNKLAKLGLTHKTIGKKIYRAVQTFDQDISNIFDELLAEAPNHRLPLMVMRNPSLHRGSVMTLYAGLIKRDVNDFTMGTSVLIAKLPNKDYDGDALNIAALLDHRLERLFAPMRVEYSVPNLSTVGQTSSLFNLTDPGAFTLALRIREEALA